MIPFVNVITERQEAGIKIKNLLSNHQYIFLPILLQPRLLPISVKGDRQISLITSKRKMYHSLPSVMTKLRLVS